MLETIVFIVILFAALVIVYKVIKSLIKVAIIGLIVLLFIACVTAALANHDFGRLEREIGEGHVIVMFHDESLTAAVSVINRTPQAMPVQGLTSLFESGSYGKLQGNASYLIVCRADMNSTLPKILQADSWQLYRLYTKGTIGVHPRSASLYLVDRVPGILVAPILYFL